ncbi:MAG: hypothetical protein H7Y86_12620 [Rhizobacter sp.]|nr:hypothetical protein [Ferruginibacter sp.]
MKSLKFLFVPLLVLSAGIFLPGCKKDNDDAGSCRIITVTPSAGNGFNFTYNSSGKTETMTNGNSLTVFSYGGNVIISTTTVNGNFSSKRIATLIANGFAANVKTETSADGSTWYKDTYEYNGTELIKDTYTNSQNVVPEVTTVGWSGGNLVSTTREGVTTHIEYYTDKPSQTGDYLALMQMIQGYKVYNTKNVIKSLITGTTITSFDYTYEEGKITALKFNGDGTIINYNFQYQCN